MEGRIVALNCGIYNVISDGKFFSIPAKGNFRIKNIKPVVGDFVEISKEGVIEKISPRKSFLKRPCVSNVDEMMITLSLIEPEFSYLLAFKYLTYANMNNIPASLIITKQDKSDSNLINEIKNTFNVMGVNTYFISNKSKEGLSELEEAFKNKTICLLGQSGVGKSSTINSLNPNFNREIGEYSYALGRGKHQTKEVILLPFKDGFLADTPGFSSLDLNLFKEDLAQYFPKFDKYYLDCFYSNCLHITENKCAVKEAIKNNEISQIAYDCYIKLSNEAIFRNQRYNK